MCVMLVAANCGGVECGYPFVVGWSVGTPLWWDGVWVPLCGGMECGYPFVVGWSVGTPLWWDGVWVPLLIIIEK